MANFKVVGDSCCDFTKEMKEDFGFIEVPLTLSIGDYVVTDDDNFVSADFLRKMRASTECPKSACPSPDDYMKVMDCEEDVYVVTLSDKLSGSYNSAVQAQKLLKEEKGKTNIYVFNSCSASAGQYLIAMKIHELATKGKSFLEVIVEINLFIAGQKIFFVLEDLNILRKNGRLNPVQAVLTNVLNVKLIMSGTEDGNIYKIGQALNIGRALTKLAETVTKQATDCAEKILTITHCDCVERALSIKEQILAKCPFKESVILESGGISTMYANAGGVIVSF